MPSDRNKPATRLNRKPATGAQYTQQNHQCRRGMSAAAIEAALLTENTIQCDPPLSELSLLAEVMKGNRPTLTLKSKQGGRRHGW